jgi:hypothetical protein
VVYRVCSLRHGCSCGCLLCHAWLQSAEPGSASTCAAYVRTPQQAEHAQHDARQTQEAPTCTVSSSRRSGQVVVLLPPVLLLRASASSRSSTCGLVNKLNSSAWCSTRCTASTILSPNSLKGWTPEALEVLSEPAGTSAPEPPAAAAPGDTPAVPPGALNSSPWTAAERASMASQEWGGGRGGRAAAAGVCMSRCSRGLKGAHEVRGALQGHQQGGGSREEPWDAALAQPLDAEALHVRDTP